MPAQVVAVAEPNGRRVVFVVEPVGSEVRLDQTVAGAREGYRGRFTSQEAAELGAALLRAAGAVDYGS
jgi:hypothetical protein